MALEAQATIIDVSGRGLRMEDSQVCRRQVRSPWSSLRSPSSRRPSSATEIIASEGSHKITSMDSEKRISFDMIDFLIIFHLWMVIYLLVIALIKASYEQHRAMLRFQLLVRFTKTPFQSTTTASLQESNFLLTNYLLGLESLLFSLYSASKIGVWSSATTFFVRSGILLFPSAPSAMSSAFMKGTLSAGTATGVIACSVGMIVDAEDEASTTFETAVGVAVELDQAG
jgi:hypothetical protein